MFKAVHIYDSQLVLDPSHVISLLVTLARIPHKTEFEKTPAVHIAPVPTTQFSPSDVPFKMVTLLPPHTWLAIIISSAQLIRLP